MRALLLAGGLSLGTLALAGFSPAMAHVGHGDEFQQQGNVRQVKASADIDSMLGITTAPAKEAGGVVSIPVAAVVDAGGKPLAFVKSGTTYDPVFLQTGASQGDQIAITDGSISPGDNVVTQGALSLYAESKKSQSAVAARAAAPAAAAPAAVASPAAAEAPTPQAAPTATAGFNPLVIGAGAAVLVAGAGVVVSRLGKKN
jgi:cation efflux system membrane fusion protein